jgi:hypothetical protein
VGTRGERRRLAALAVAALTTLGVVVPVAVAHADDPPEPVRELGASALPGQIAAMVVDPATERVFVSMPVANGVAVYDADGKFVTTIAHEAGANGLALADGHLYVAAANAGAIDEIDTTTLTRTRTVASGLSSMTDLVAAGDALWVTAVGSAASAVLTRVEIAGGVTTSYPSLGYMNGLAAAPGNPTQLVMYEPGMSPASFARIDVSTNPPTRAVYKTSTAPSVSNVRGVAISPDGTRLVPAGGAPYQFNEYRMSDIAATGVVYPAAAYPIAITIGEHVLVGGMSSTGRDVVMYAAGDPSTLLGSYDFWPTSTTVVRGGVALSPDESRAFVVTGPSTGAPGGTLHVLSVPGHQSSATSSSSTSSSTTSSTSSTTTSSTTSTTAAPANAAQSAPSLTISPVSGSFGAQRVGTYGRSVTVTVSNTSGSSVTIKNMTVGGTNPTDFFGTTNCGRTLATGASCRAVLYFAPLRVGGRRANLVITDNTAASPHRIAINGTGTEGYYIGGAHGQVANFGDAVYHGDTSDVPLHAPIVSLRTTPTGAGYWLLGRDGGIFSFGNAHFYGSTGNLTLRQPVLGMTPTLDGKGYWLVASDGGIFAFGDAHFYGSTGNIALRKPIVGMATTPSGRGYWMVASDGGIFAFGDARFFGSTGNIALRKPIVGMAATPSGRGYWLVASDGGIFAFGDAHFYGAPSATSGRIVGIASTPAGRGYWTLTNTGTVGHFGDAPFYGDVRSVETNEAIGIAPTAPMLPPELLGYRRAALSSMPGELGARRDVARVVER